MLSLISEVEEQGGIKLAETCTPRKLIFENQPANIYKFDADAPRSTRQVATTGCKRSNRFIVPLLDDEIVGRVLPDDTEVAETTDVPGEFEHREIELDDFDFDDLENQNALTTGGFPVPVTACAVDDAMGLWPRFQSAMHTGESWENADLRI